MNPSAPPRAPLQAGDRAELDRIRRVYQAYADSPRHRRMWAQGRASTFMLERKWRGIARLLRGAKLDLGRARILDVGAGGGEDCARFLELGADAANVVAVDLMVSRVRPACSRFRAAVAHAGRLPFPASSFDLVYQSTMLSSVLDRSMRRAILEEMRRVLAPGGLLLSYDLRYRNPFNAHTRPLRVRELAASLPEWPLLRLSVTALPPLLRALAPISMAACRAAEAVPPLRSHLLVLARKPAA